MLELRVLTGTHAGARVLLPDQPQQLGSAADCDLILTDEGLQAHHASIEAREDGSVLLRWLEDAGAEVVLQPGEGAELGPVRIAVEAADSPWREDVPLRGPPALRSPEDAAAAGPAAARTRSAPSATTSAHAARAARGLPLLGGALAGLGLAGTLAALVMTLLPSLDLSALLASPDPAASTPAAPSPLAQATAALEALGLGRKARVELDPRLGLRVRAAYLDETQVHALQEALQKLPQPPRLDLLTPTQVQALLEDALLMQEGASGKGLAAIALDEGRFRIEGRVASHPQRDELLAQLARAVPLVQGLESGLATDEDEAQALLQALRELGVAEVEGEWSGGRLALRARIAPALLPRWERGLALAAAAHPVPFHVAVSPAPPPPAPTLPFALRSVIGGAMPFVTLADGRRLGLDGQAEGWRLVAIRPEAVVFENAQGLRFTLER